MKQVAVIIPCLNESRYIIQSVEAIVAQDYPKEFLEVCFVDGMSTDGTLEILKDVASKYPWIHILINTNKTVPFALNLAINQSHGEIVIRMDVHSHFPKTYISKLVDWMEYLDIDNVGGICYTDVLNKDNVSEAVRLVMSDKFGVGDSTFRVGTRKLTEVDTVPFGCYKREVFSKIGLFDERLTRNQDIEFNKRLKRAGGKIYLVPDVHSTYYARDTFRSLYKNRFNTGMWIVKTSFITKNLKNLSIRHFVPLVFVLGILVPILFSVIIPFAWALSVFIFGLYVIVLGKRSLKIATSSTSSLHVFAGFAVLHFSYGLGSLWGLKNFPKYFYND